MPTYVIIGPVEHIGLKSTRIGSLSGEQLIFSNSDLLNSHKATGRRAFSSNSSSQARFYRYNYTILRRSKDFYSYDTIYFFYS